MPCLPVDSAMSCSAQSANPTMWVPSETIAELVLKWVGARNRGGEHEARVHVVVGDQLEDGRVRLIQERVDVDPSEPRGHEAERGEGGVAAADVRVGVEHVVPVGARRNIEW